MDGVSLGNTHTERGLTYYEVSLSGHMCVSISPDISSEVLPCYVVFICTPFLAIRRSFELLLRLYESYYYLALSPVRVPHLAFVVLHLSALLTLHRDAHARLLVPHPNDIHSCVVFYVEIY